MSAVRHRWFRRWSASARQCRALLPAYASRGIRRVQTGWSPCCEPPFCWNADTLLPWDDSFLGHSDSVTRALSLRFCGDKEFLRRHIVLYAQYIRLTADLAIFDIALSAAGGFIHRSCIPLSAGGALETGFHVLIDSIPQGILPTL